MVRLNHSPLFGYIREYLLNSHKSETIFLFVPYVKTKVLEKLLDGIKNRAVLVTTWKPRDIQFGSSEISLYPFCRERGIALYVSRSMHLKVYSVGLSSAILATGNVSQMGLLPGGNYEAGAMIEPLTNEDRLFFEKIRREARLVDDKMHEELKEWSEKNKADLPEETSLDDIVSEPKRDYFLISALPMTKSVEDLVSGYRRICSGKSPSDNPETAACVFHDLANYGIEPGMSESKFRQELSFRFFAHPFIQKINELIAPEAYFGSIKEWIQNNCTDVPVPSRRKLTGNVQVLLEWFVRLGNKKYVVDVPGSHSQRIRKTT
ncbi:MAG: hypothetical protein OXI27_00690 [Thaumarchaeota archaeon]|nr:hypothetical protein [Nitrososphaerota archaeon]